MISGTFHISENSTTWDEGWNARPASASIQLSPVTYMIIKNVSVRLGCNTANDVSGNFYFILNNVQVFTESYTLKAEDGNSQWVSFSTNIIINIGDSVNLYTETGAGRQARAYYGTSGNFSIGAINNPTNAAEMILDIDYVPIWTIDGQNDGYAYPTGTDPTEFTEFEKDEDGYPLNWGVWKLDDQNEGYPWPTGYLPARNMGAGILVKEQNQWRNAGIVIYQNSTYRIGNVLIYKN